MRAALVVIAILGGCSGGGAGTGRDGGGDLASSGAGPSALGESPPLAGQVTGWAMLGGSADTLAVLIDDGTGHAGTPVGATGSIDAAGNFSVVLPSSAQLQPFLKALTKEAIAPPCPAPPFSVSAPGAQIAAIYGFKTGKGAALQQLDNVGAQHTIYVWYVFVDRDVSMTGTNGGQRCAIDLRAGWNYYLDEIDASGSAMYVKQESTGALPSGTVWQ